MKIWMEYCDKPVVTPLSFWVHRHLDGGSWIASSRFDPPRPAGIPGKGWPIWIAEHRSNRLVFGSIEEIDQAIEILGCRHLPTTRQLAEQAGYPSHQHMHWLTTLPKFWKPWKIRECLVQRLIAFKEQSRHTH